RDLLEPGTDGVAVLRPQRRERLQHHQVERAAQDFRLGRSFIRHPNGLYPRSIRKSNEDAFWIQPLQRRVYLPTRDGRVRVFDADLTAERVAKSPDGLDLPALL